MQFYFALVLKFYNSLYRFLRAAEPDEDIKIVNFHTGLSRKAGDVGKVGKGYSIASVNQHFDDVLFYLVFAHFCPFNRVLSRFAPGNISGVQQNEH